MLIMFIKKIVKYWVANGYIDATDSDIYEYGLDLILYSILNIAVILISSVLINRLFESIALLTFVIPMQSCGGGYHAKTHLRCFLIMYIGWWAIMGIVPYLTLCPALMIVGVSLGTIFALAPIRNEHVPISERQFDKMKVLVRCFSVCTAIIGVAIRFIVTENHIGNSIIIGIGAVALSMFAATLIKKLKG